MPHLMKGLVLTTKPTISPITLVELKEHLRIDATNDSEDAFLRTIILSATDYFEQRSWRQLITATYTQYFDDFPPLQFELRKPPLQSITSIKYFDANAVEQTLATSVFEVDTFSQVGRVVLADGESFPTVDDRINAVKVEYKAGYGDTRDDVPDLIMSTIKLIAAWMFENRDTVRTAASVQEIPVPQALSHLINQYSIRSFV